jgi:outer membrane protein assembly factor BamB
MGALRVMCVLALAVVVGGCSGGGGGGTTSLVPPWEKFRHDPSNSGQGEGPVANTNPPGTPRVLSIDASRISSSPAIGRDNTVYVGTEAGALAAIDPVSLAIKWMRTSCEACPQDQQKLGPLVASPAVVTFNSQTTVLIGSKSGQLLSFTDTGANNPTCAFCFQPSAADFPNATIVASRFVSSANFTTNPTTIALATIFVGATVDIIQNAAAQTVGKLYALNSDGSVQWEFPSAHDTGTIGAITSSPAFGAGSILYFTAGESLYALATDGTFLWKCGGLGCGGFPLGAVADAGATLASSPATAALTYVATAAGAAGGGAIFAISPGGSFAWRVASADGSGFISSVAIGLQAVTTPTATPTVPLTPTLRPGETPTTTPTPTPTTAPVADTIFAVTKGGTVMAIDAGTGQTKTLSNMLPAIVGPVVSSPALSNDAFLVFGSADGKLYAVNTSTGQSPNDCAVASFGCAWPVQLTQGIPIRSSPTIASDGTIFVGADDGNLYAVGTQ